MTTPDHFRAYTFEDDLLDCLPGEQKQRGQVRLARRFAATYRGRLLYVDGLGWLVWDGKRWAPDTKDWAQEAVVDVLRTALADSLDDRDLRADVRKCESANGVAGVLKLATSNPALRATVDELDADPYLLNCANGTLDLRTRQLRAHDPADRITKVTRGACDLSAGLGAWDTFLCQVLPDADVRAYLQRVIGLTVFGRVREHLFPVLIGTGQNGKGTAYEAVTKAFGDYAAIINPELLMMDGRAGGPEMMVLRGARLVVGSETGEGRRLDAPLMKRLTGGDQLTARQLYQAPVTWTPSHQLLYVTNHLPTVKGNDPAVWRRIRVIPFAVVVPEGQRDQKLPERLELSADEILSWAVRGWFDYVDRDGMDEPETVQRATDDYQTDSDAVKRFIQSECTTGPHAHVTIRSLHLAWTAWAAADGCDALGERAFAKELDRLGYGQRRTRAGIARAGLALRSEEPGNNG